MKILMNKNMLEGIEILNKVEIMESPEWIAIVSLICLIGILVGVVIFCINIFTDFLDDKWWINALLIILNYIGILLMAGLDKDLLIEPTGEYKYQVTIDDKVSMNEFLEKYEIIEINGKIYTIRDKEEVE